MVEVLSEACELAAISLLAVASFYDLKDRAVPDRVWLVGSALGISMKLFDHEGTLQFILKAWPFLMLLAIMLALEWFLSLSGQADVLAYATLSLLLTGIRMFPDALLTYLLSKIFIVLLIPVQFFINMSKVLRNPNLMKDFDEPFWRKLLAMMILSPYDKRLATCASPAEVLIDGRRKFVLKAALRISCDEPVEGGWIAPTYPAIPMILAAALVVILAP
ncbi:MAG: prepilin peptidase [Candidatus Korarchaeum sp.]|nr:prepilin peptidase [Candidatus Korarchaeum sp.]